MCVLYSSGKINVKVSAHSSGWSNSMLMRSQKPHSAMMIKAIHRFSLREDDVNNWMYTGRERCVGSVGGWLVVLWGCFFDIFVRCLACLVRCFNDMIRCYVWICWNQSSRFHWNPIIREYETTRYFSIKKLPHFLFSGFVCVPNFVHLLLFTARLGPGSWI